MRVAILDDFHNAYEATEGVGRLRERAEVQIFTSSFGKPSALSGFDAFLANRERTHFTKELLQEFPDLRIIAQTGNHAQHINLSAAKEMGVIVGQASGGYSIGAAELSVGITIALMRQIASNDMAIRRGEWTAPLTPILSGKILGIIGLGRVGQHVARIGAAFGMRVVAWSPNLTDETAAARGAEYRELDELLRIADVVSIHASLKTETRGLIDAYRIGLMKPTAYLVNTARGPIIDEAALVSALKENRIAGAALDVFDQEPLPPGHPFTELSNTVLTPHMGWPTDQGYAQFSNAAADVLIAYLDGVDFPTFTD